MINPISTARVAFNQVVVRLKRANRFRRNSCHALPSSNQETHCRWRETKQTRIAYLWRPHLANNAHDFLRHLAIFSRIDRANSFLDDTSFSGKYFVRTDE